MGNVILHISDLHVSTKVDGAGITNERVDSYFTSDDTATSTHYVATFTDTVKKEFPNETLYLLITGDISDSGEKIQFSEAKRLITKIMSDLNIPTERLLLLPGDHDVHRRSLENETAERPNRNSHLLNSVKFLNFAEFYKDMTGKNFPFDKVIVDHIIVDSVVFVGFNSNYKINARGGLGHIPIQQFNEEINLLKQQIGEGKQWVACWHHNLTAGYDNSNDGQWETENRLHLLSDIERQDIKLIVSGNEHIMDAKTILSSIYTSDSGTFSTVKYESSFKAYPLLNAGEIALVNKMFALQKVNGNDLKYFWDVRDNDSAKQINKFELYKANAQVIHDIKEIPSESEVIESSNEHDDLQENTKTLVRYDNPAFSDKLYSLVRDKKLFHSGHFHWSESSRAHNWIDVSKLLENSKDLYFVQNSIIDIIDTFHLEENCNLVIGLGYEGNIISSKASIKYNIPYTSLPYSYRYSDHHDYEKKLNYNNDDGAFKTVMIVTDVVNDGRTLRKLIKEQESAFFEKVKKIIVLSLFYTGHEELSTVTLNNSSNEDNDYSVNNIEYYSIKQLRVEKCPFGKDYREECLIYKDQLSCVHLFYDERNP